jgi:hypothetical protein
VQSKSYYTTGEIAALYGVPCWAVRRVIDALGGDVPRAGLYRLIPCDLLGRVKEKLREAGYLRREEAARG